MFLFAVNKAGGLAIEWGYVRVSEGGIGSLDDILKIVLGDVRRKEADYLKGKIRKFIASEKKWRRNLAQ